MHERNSAMREKRAAADHESGHCYFANEFQFASPVTARVYEEDGKWEGLSELPGPQALFGYLPVPLGGVVAEAKGLAERRYGAKATVAIDAKLLAALMAYIPKAEELFKKGVKGQPLYFYVPEEGQPVEAAISYDDITRLPNQYKNDSEAIRIGLQQACTACNDQAKWERIKSLSDELYVRSPKALTWDDIRPLLVPD